MFLYCILVCIYFHGKFHYTLRTTIILLGSPIYSFFEQAELRAIYFSQWRLFYTTLKHVKSDDVVDSRVLVAENAETAIISGIIKFLPFASFASRLEQLGRSGVFLVKFLVFSCSCRLYVFAGVHLVGVFSVVDGFCARCFRACRSRDRRFLRCFFRRFAHVFPTRQNVV